MTFTVQKTTTRHYTENYTEQFLSVAEAWGVKQKVTTTESVQTMIAAARQLPFVHMPSVLLTFRKEPLLFLPC